MFQSVNLVPFLTARENLLALAELSGANRAERRRAKQRADQLLDELGIGNRRGHVPARTLGRRTSTRPRSDVPS